ncbi:MAG: helix-turn-helix domain-containing protein [Chloroflexi bacterium]|nr:helix-turn-helix domain-containing protein [Chloroflexota bacterium]
MDCFWTVHPWTHGPTTSVPLSVADAAKHAHCSTKTIRRWLTSGRLQASRGPDGAWVIDQADLERAIATPGPSTDSPTLATGRRMDMTIVQELLDRLERQAERLGQQLDAELVSTRAPRRH